MRSGGTRTGRGSQLVLATGVWLAALAATANAQFFGSTQGPDTFTLRPPRDVPSAPPAPAQSLIPPSGNVAPSAAPKGPLLQSLPAAANPGAPAHAAVNVPSVPAGQGALAVSARFGHDLPAIGGGLHWRGLFHPAERHPRPWAGGKGTAPTPPSWARRPPGVRG